MGRPREKSDDDEGAELSAAIERLTDEVHTLRIAMDELREELVWELRQLREGTPERQARCKLRSMPPDPTGPYVHQRVNAVDASVFETTDPLTKLIERFTALPPTDQLAAEDWIEDQEFTPGEVTEIEEAMRDWFA